jgi:hypothetical protein
MDTIEDPTYQRTEFINTIKQYPGKILNLGHVRKAARASGSILGQGDDGDSLTNSNITATGVTITPVHRYIQVAWSGAEKAQVDVDLNSEAAGNIEQGLAETMDSAGLVSVSTGTNTMSQANPDAATWRQAVGRLMTNTNGAFMPGESKMIRAIFSTTQYPSVMGIDEFTHADVRGDSETPNVKGIFTKGGGINVRFSTVVLQDANGWHNPIYVDSAFIIGWNQRTTAFKEQTELLFRINVSANMGVSVLHDLRFIDYRTTASAL